MPTKLFNEFKNWMYVQNSHRSYDWFCYKNTIWKKVLLKRRKMIYVVLRKIIILGVIKIIKKNQNPMTHYH